MATTKPGAQKTSAETALKAEEARKLIDEIDKLQTTATTARQAPPAPKPEGGEEKLDWLAERIVRLEEQQNTARSHLEKLAEAKRRLEIAAKKSQELENKHQQEANRKLQEQLSSLIADKEKEYSTIQTQIQVIRAEADQQSAKLKAERDEARIDAQVKQEAGQAQLVIPAKHKKMKKILLISGGSIMGILLVAGAIFFGLDSNTLNKFFVNDSAPTKVAAAKQNAGQSNSGGLSGSEGDEEEGEENKKKAEPVKAKRAYRDRLRSGGLGPIMVELPGGWFWIGSRTNRPHPDELPQTDIELSGFSISRFEVSVKEYTEFAKATKRKVPQQPWKGDKLPVVNVTWDDAAAYTQWLSTQTGRQYRLPSEREWEYAAYSGLDTQKKDRFIWGDSIESGKANCAVCETRWSAKQPAPVGQFPANHVGLRDMQGNVSEWVYECRHPNYIDTPAGGQIWEGGDCSKRMVRGGSFRSYERDLRLTIRKAYNPKARSDEIGFRVVRVN